ncbi:MAG TPA: hypothetical protein VJU80_08695 [Solirubrobacteraceae bacterium]|nr:hypothetical protein [Solirubrobacteraceae bacterium]
MAKTVEQWTDARLNDLATAFAPVPTQLATLSLTVSQVERVTTELEPVPAKLAALTATVERLTDENRALRAELSAIQRQFLQVSWALVAAVLGAAAGGVLAGII